MGFFSKLFGRKTQKASSSNANTSGKPASGSSAPAGEPLYIYDSGLYPADAHSSDPFLRAKAYERGSGVEMDKAKAAGLYREAMNQGDRRAKHNLALMYLHQEGGLTDIATGVRMLQELADEGEEFSIIMLAKCYLDGEGVEKDTGKGLELLQILSDKGSGSASYAIGSYYNNDCHEFEKGRRYLDKAAEQGFTLAASILEQVYDQGMGVEKDAEKAWFYLKRAAELGDARCQFKYGVFCRDDITEAMEWMMKSADQKYPPALLMVGREYLNPGSHLFSNPRHFFIGVGMLREAAAAGIDEAKKFLAHYGLEQELSSDDRIAMWNNVLKNADDETANNAFQQMLECCDIGDPAALCIIGMYYYDGTFGNPDKERGLQLIKKACDSDYPYALNLMGLILNKEGKYDESFPYYKRSAELGDMHGLHNLANAYFYARGVEQDDQKALSLWQESAQKGNPDTIYTIGNMYLQGTFMEKDIQKAIQYFTITAGKECSSQGLAMKKLVEVYRLIGDEQMANEWETRLHELES